MGYFNDKFKERCKDRGTTPYFVALDARIEPSLMSAIMRGNRRPKVETWKAIIDKMAKSEILNTPVMELIQWRAIEDYGFNPEVDSPKSLIDDTIVLPEVVVERVNSIIFDEQPLDTTSDESSDTSGDSLDTGDDGILPDSLEPLPMGDVQDVSNNQEDTDSSTSSNATMEEEANPSEATGDNEEHGEPGQPESTEVETGERVQLAIVGESQPVAKAVKKKSTVKSKSKKAVKKTASKKG